MATAPLILPGWTTAQFPVGPSAEARLPFPDAALAAAEDQALTAVQEPANRRWLWLLAWLLAAWPLDEPAYGRWRRQLTTLAVPVDPWRHALAHAQRAGAQTVRRAGGRTLSRPPVWIDRVAPERLWIDGWAEAQRAWDHAVLEALRAGADRADLRRVAADLWRRQGVAWRRRIVTELSRAYQTGLLTALPGPAWGYVAPIGDARVCARCHRLLEGRWFRLLPAPPRAPTRTEWLTAFWPGKPAQWQGRDVPALPQHPFCRHLIQRIRFQPPPERR
ncbi:MAG: hypothetical protein K6V97_03940 [Actinomycetia bacterium]|nr:hypothetical protein [Actinomycetes bacterium]